MSMNKDLLLSLLETLAEQSKNANNTKMRQYNTANKNPHNYSTRPVQRASHNSGAHAKPRPNVSHVAKEHYFEGSHNLEESSDFEGIGQGSLDYASSEGVGQGSLDYTSSEGKPGFQGSPGLEGSLSSEGDGRHSKNNIVTLETPSQTASFNLSEISKNDIVRGIILSEILSKPKALRRNQW